MLESVLILLADLGLFAQEAEEVFQQVVVVHHLLLQLRPLVTLIELVDFVGHAVEEGVAVIGFLAGRAAGVARVADQIGHDFRFWIVFRFNELWVNVLNDVFQDRFGLALIENGIVALEADQLAVHAEDALGDAMEGAAPKVAAGNPCEILDALQHLARGLVGESEQEDLVGLHALVQQVGHAVGEGARLARARAGQHQRRAGRCCHGGVLLVVEFGFEIDGWEGELHLVKWKVWSGKWGVPSCWLYGEMR